MKRAKEIIAASLRQINSVLPSQSSTNRSVLHYNQVNQYPSQNFSSSSLFGKPNFSYVDHKIIKHFSSNPDLTVDLVMKNDCWSDEREHELRKTKPTNKSVLYVLRKLSETPKKAYNFFKWTYDNNKDNGIKPSSSVFNLMLRVLSEKEFIKEFLVVMKKMNDEGCELEEAVYVKILGNLKKQKLNGVASALVEFFEEESASDGIVKSVVSVIRELEYWNDDVLGKLEEMNLLLSEDMLLKIVRGLRGCPLKGVEFFGWVADKRGFRHNAVTYNALLRVLGHEDSVGKFWDVVKEMKTLGHEIEFDTYVKLARQFQKGKLMKDAVELYELMMDGPYKPSVQDCSTLSRQISMHAYPDISLVHRVVKKHESVGRSLSKADYDGIHRCLASVGKFDEAEEIMETMKNAGHEPDNITYGQVVFGLCKAGRLEVARQMLDEMESKGCTPDLKTWTILIQGLCVAGDVDKALTCYTDMIGKNCQSDADLLAVLVTGLCKVKTVSTAYTLAVEMIELGHLRPWQATYKFLIHGLLAERKFEESIKLLCSMKRHNYPPFQDPFVQYVSKFGTVDDAKEYLKAITVKDYPSNSAYVNLFQAFFNQGRISEAQDLLYICPQHIHNHRCIVKQVGLTKAS